MFPLVDVLRRRKNSLNFFFSRISNGVDFTLLFQVLYIYMLGSVVLEADPSLAEKFNWRFTLEIILLSGNNETE